MTPNEFIRLVYFLTLGLVFLGWDWRIMTSPPGTTAVFLPIDLAFLAVTGLTLIYAGVKRPPAPKPVRESPE